MDQKEEAKKKYIIILEDNDILSSIIDNDLRDAGYRVSIARDGEAGVELILKEKPDLLLLDILMPKMNGYGVLEKLKEAGIFPPLPVIVISNSGQPIEYEHLKAKGVLECIIKADIEPIEILHHVDRFFHIDRSKVEAAPAVVNANKTPSTPIGINPDSNVKKSILLVEDEMFLIDLLKYKFEERGHAVETAMSVAEAKEILAVKPVRLILLDVMLPDMNGFDYLETLKKNEKLKDIPVIIISNLGQKKDIERGLALGAIEYIIKANASPSEIVSKAEDIIKSYHL